MFAKMLEGDAEADAAFEHLTKQPTTAGERARALLRGRDRPLS